MILSAAAVLLAALLHCADVARGQVTFADTNDSLPTSGRMLAASELGDAFQLLSQYSYGTIGECPDKFKMDVPGTAHASGGFYTVPYTSVKIELGGWTFPSLNAYEFTGVRCAGPTPASALVLQRGETVVAELFAREHAHSSSTLTLYESLGGRFASGNYWTSTPNVEPFNCSKGGAWPETAWFREGFAFLFFREQGTVPITFVGKVRPDGSERLIMLNMTGTIRYMIASASKTTCIYRAMIDVERVMNETRAEEEKEREREQGGAGSSSPAPRSPAPQTPLPPGASPSASPAAAAAPACNCRCPRPGREPDRTKPGGPWYGPVVPKDRRRRRRRRGPWGGGGNRTRGGWSWNWLWCGPGGGGHGGHDGNGTTAGDAAAERDDGASACFPGAARVVTLRGVVRMDALRVGDRALSAGGAFSPVFAFSHAAPRARARFVSLRTLGGRVALLSPGHLLRAGGALKRAGAVRAGDAVRALDVVGRERGDVVAGVARARARGLYNPHTLAGTIVVDGVLATCYTDAAHAPAAHAALAPLRALASAGAPRPAPALAVTAPRLARAWRALSRA